MHQSFHEEICKQYYPKIAYDIQLNLLDPSLYRSTNLRLKFVDGGSSSKAYVLHSREKDEYSYGLSCLIHRLIHCSIREEVEDDDVLKKVYCQSEKIQE